MSAEATSEVLIPLEQRRDWEQALDGVPHSFAHTWDHNHAIAASSGLATYLYSFASPDARVLCPLAERPAGDRSDVVTPYGFSGFVGAGEYGSFPSRWSQFANGRGFVCGYLIVNPVLPNSIGFDEAEPHRVLFVLDLGLEEEALFARLSSNRRRQVRRSDANPGALTTDRDSITEFFVETYPSFVAKRGAAGVYDLNEQSLREFCASSNVLLLGAQEDGRVVAASLFGFTPHAGDFLFNVSVEGGGPYSVMLIWAAVRELKKRGVPTLNLGGGVSEDDSLAEFKRRFGADEVTVRHAKQVYDPDAYAALCREAGVEPTTSGYFPAYRRAAA